MAKPLSKTVVVAYGRSAVAKSGKKGALRNMHPIDMGGLVLKGVMEKLPQLDPALVEDVILGCAIPEAKQGLNPARLVAARAGLPYTACGLTVDRFCSSSLQAVALAAWQIEAGQADCIVAGGIESMTALPMTLDRSGDRDPWLVEHDPAQYISNGETAENVAEKYNVTREEMDLLALESHRKAAHAQDAGYFDEQIIPLPGVDAEGNEIVFDKDQGIRRDTTLEKMASMKPCFKENGRVTAATSSQTSDGAAFLVLMSRDKAAELGIKPLASFLGFCVGGLDPAYMGLGPIYAVPKVMEYTGLTVDDMDVIELNEAFAAQVSPCIKELGLNPEKVNPNGGAMALGHPLGATGAVLSCKAISELRRTGGKYALVTMCIAGGMGAAGISLDQLFQGGQHSLFLFQKSIVLLLLFGTAVLDALQNLIGLCLRFFQNLRGLFFRFLHCARCLFFCLAHRLCRFLLRFFYDAVLLALNIGELRAEQVRISHVMLIGLIAGLRHFLFRLFRGCRRFRHGLCSGYGRPSFRCRCLLLCGGRTVLGLLRQLLGPGRVGLRLLQLPCELRDLFAQFLFGAVAIFRHPDLRLTFRFLLCAFLFRRRLTGNIDGLALLQRLDLFILFFYDLLDLITDFVKLVIHLILVITKHGCLKYQFLHVCQ